MSTITHQHGLKRSASRPQDVEAAPPEEAAAEVRPLERALLTPEEAARVLGIGRSKLYELILTGALESLKIGACRRVPTDAIEAFIGALREGQR